MPVAEPRLQNLATVKFNLWLISSASVGLEACLQELVESKCQDLEKHKNLDSRF